MADSVAGTLSLLLGGGASNLASDAILHVGPIPAALAADFDGDGNWRRMTGCHYISEGELLEHGSHSLKIVLLPIHQRHLTVESATHKLTTPSPAFRLLYGKGESRLLGDWSPGNGHRHPFASSDSWPSRPLFPCLSRRPE